MMASLHTVTQGDPLCSIFSLWLLKLSLILKFSWKKGKDREELQVGRFSGKAWREHLTLFLIGQETHGTIPVSEAENIVSWLCVQGKGEMNFAERMISAMDGGAFYCIISDYCCEFRTMPYIIFA